MESPLRANACYPFAHEIIVAEGGQEDAKSAYTTDGHAVDGTLETLFKFKPEEDHDNKLAIITSDGFWLKRNELGRHRTPQSRADAEKATGDYLWQINRYSTPDSILSKQPI